MAMRRDIFLLAASVGGVDALNTCIRTATSLPATVLIVLHIGGHESQLPSI